MVAAMAGAIGEPARARMLYALLDGHARTSTELAVIAEVSPSTASTHLSRLKSASLIEVHVQGKHRYYGLTGRSVARVLEGLSVLAGTPRKAFQPATPDRLRCARTCYDHIAGALGVTLHDRLIALRWIVPRRSETQRSYDITGNGATALQTLGIALEELRSRRRRFAFPCLDWSERRPHIGGALGAGLLQLALRRNWVEQDRDLRSLQITRLGRREMASLLGLQLASFMPADRKGP